MRERESEREKEKEIEREKALYNRGQYYIKDVKEEEGEDNGSLFCATDRLIAFMGHSARRQKIIESMKV